jgi:hypothetical protein
MPKRLCPFFEGNWGDQGYCRLAVAWDTPGVDVTCRPQDQKHFTDFRGFNITKDGEAGPRYFEAMRRRPEDNVTRTLETCRCPEITEFALERRRI